MKLSHKPKLALTLGAALTFAAFMIPEPSMVHSSKEMAARDRFSPVLPFSTTNKVEVNPYHFTRDPNLTKFIPEDNYGVSRLSDEIKEARTDLQHAKGFRALELHQQAYRAYAAISYYLESQGDKHTQDLTALRRQLEFHAGQAMRLAKGRDLEEASYHFNVTRYMTKEQGITEIKGLARSIGNRSLRDRLVALTLLHDLRRAHGGERQKLLRNLAQTAKTLPKESHSSLYFVMAENAAGLSTEKTVLPEYKSYLALAMTKTDTALAQNSNEVLGQGIRIWQAGERKKTSKMDWTKPPFALKKFSDTPNAKALIERRALSLWEQGEHGKSVKTYQVLAQSESDAALAIKLKMRSLDLLSASNKAKISLSQYEKHLAPYLDASEGSEVLGKAQQLYSKLATDALKEAEKKPSALAASVALSKRYLAAHTDPKGHEATKALLAKVLLQYKRYSEAKAYYIELADASQDARKLEYRALSIRAATPLAGWDESVPWTKLQLLGQTNRTAERQELLNLYTQLETEKGAETWFSAGHRGLLMLALGDGDGAFKLWQERLDKSTNGEHAARASGYMLTFYSQQKSWDLTEGLARKLMAKKVIAKHLNRDLKPKDFLALSLLEGGKEALAGRNYAVSVKKLKEFQKNHSDAVNYDEGYYLLGHAFYGNREFDSAVKNMIGFTQSERDSRYMRDALLNGGKWAQSMAYEESTVYFYQSFVDGYAKDQDAPTIRRNLERLYLGLQHYAKAIALLEAEKSYVDAEQGKDVTHKIMLIEDRFGSEMRANVHADALVKEGTGLQIEDAYLIKARYAFKKGDVGKLKKYAAHLENGASPEALGEVKFFMAELATKDLIHENFNLELKDPKSTLSARYSAFNAAKIQYQAVCAHGSNRACPDAMVKLSQLSLAFMASIEDIQIQSTLSKEEVTGFEQYKAKIMDDVATVAENSDSSAVSAVQSGQTDPDATMAVMWHNTSDWTFDRVTGDSGNGYVQIHEPKN